MLKESDSDERRQENTITYYRSMAFRQNTCVLYNKNGGLNDFCS